MPKLAAPLTDVQARSAKPKDKPYKLSDGGGLYMLVNTDGAKLAHGVSSGCKLIQAAIQHACRLR